MDKEVSYDQLLMQYNILVARVKDLEEQAKEKNVQWQQEEERNKDVQKTAKKLCEMILAKDRTEVTAGNGDTWFYLPIKELIERAVKSYQAYNIERTEIMSKLLDKIELLQSQNESLQDQIEQLMIGNHTDLSLAQKIVEQKALQEEGKKKVPNSLQQAANSGAVELIIEEDTDSDDMKETQLNEYLMEINEQAKITAMSIPVKPNSQKQKKREQQKDNAMMAHMIDLVEYEQKMNAAMWKIVELIGKEGLSKYPEIEQIVLESNSEWKKSRLRMATKELFQMGIITMEAINLPLTPKVFVHHLTEIGSRLYRKKYNEKAVVSEVERVIAEHDNAEHGYGILDVEKILTDTGKYKEISSFNRSKAIQLKDGKKYIPDLICQTNRYTEYIEYERGLHTQSDFSDKCNKMTQVTRFLNFVVPNKNVLIKRLMPQVDAWIKTRGAESLKNIKIRITTAIALKDSDMKSDECWLVIYDMKKGTAPVKCPD